MSFPTYGTGEPDRNPMFLEKRVYQGSSGRVYPLAVIDRIDDEPEDRDWKVIVLENRWLEVWVMPDLGGRIQRARDKTNDYDFVYYNHVIKPALVGLAGPWISGGIEFNWPQHHRPSTYEPVEFATEERDDGAATVHLAEIDRMYGTRGGVSISLRPDRAYIEIEGRLYNGTDTPQTFLWWANPAYAVNNDTQSIFPPDVRAVMDHGKRDTSRFPIATGTYYKTDFSAGVDISRYRNIPVPMSYMAASSAYDFVGAYDYGRNAGLLHVADRHVSPGKKQWTWGSGDFGKAWDRNLTDADGPYVELMTGVFTDNQPDFTWLRPYEEKRFVQFFMPYKELGAIKDAHEDGAVALDIDGLSVRAGAYATGPMPGAKLIVRSRGPDGGRSYLDSTMDLSPEAARIVDLTLDPGTRPEEVHIELLDGSGRLVASYQPEAEEERPLPETAKPIAPPQELASNEALYLAGIHLEQYRHATFNPEDYYAEALARDPGDLRVNCAYGLRLLKRGRLAEAETRFRAAVERATRHNPNPYDGEPHFNLGLALLYQGRAEEAFEAFYKSTWSYAYQHAGFLALGRIAMTRGKAEDALRFTEESLARNTRSIKSRHLKAMALRSLGRTGKAVETATDTLRAEPLDPGALAELAFASGPALHQAASPELDGLLAALRGSPDNYLELAADYGSAGAYADAAAILELGVDRAGLARSPLVLYRLALFRERAGAPEAADAARTRAASAPSDYCFPNRLDDMIALERALQSKPDDGRAAYYLGNFRYDRRDYDRAVDLWERAARHLPDFPTVRRNLALAYYNKLGRPDDALVSLEAAFTLGQDDARLLLELDQLHKKMGKPVSTRLARLDAWPELVARRDDLCLERATLLNLLGRHEDALAILENRRFHPWEGGEGKPTKQYVAALLGLARAALAAVRADAAITLAQRASRLPINLGEGKLAGACDNDRLYILGLAFNASGDTRQAAKAWEAASVGLTEPASAMFYNDQPPESIFYQGLALLRLGQRDRAMSRFNTLIDYGERHRFDAPRIDYFAISLPDFLIFEEDLERRNAIHCRYLIALGRLGAAMLSGADRTSAYGELKAILVTEPAHQGAIEILESREMLACV